MMRHFALIAALLFCTAGSAAALPSYEQVKASNSSSDAFLLDRHGNVIQELRVDPQRRRLAWTALSEISPALIKAVIRSEDRRFYEHTGVDWKAILSAAAGNIFSHGSRGASTISMQLAALLEKTTTNKKRSIGQKWEQMKSACELEKTWSKDNIFEAYLNLVTFRGELQGITAASRGLFDKDAGGLDECEACILAVLIRSPNATPQKAADRAAMLAASLGINMPASAIKQLALDRLSKTYVVRRNADLAPHVARLLLAKGATSVRSTIDGELQRFVLDTLNQAVGGLSRQNVRDGAVLVADNKSGEVLAYAGNVGALSSAEYVDGVQARRQAGSTLKPFLYGLTIDMKILTAASLIEDSPLEIPTERGMYRPENYDKEFRGVVTARVALASSLNIPAVKTLGLVGTASFVKKLKDFGFSNLAEPEQYGPSLALGTADISLWEMVNAYRTLANRGVWTQLRLSTGKRIQGKHEALSAASAFIVSDILSDREARSATFSLESPLATRFWTAAKTGTSKDMRDNWCIGYSDRYTVGVWVGNFSGAPMWNVSGVSGAAPVWLEIMNYLHRDRSSKRPETPAGVIVAAVSPADGNSGRKKEFFIAGTEHKSVQVAASTVYPKILYPSPGMVIAIDPDIPASRQKVFIETSAADTNQQLRIDDNALENVSRTSWTPVPGFHRISLIDKNGSVEDMIVFEVR